MTNGPIRYWVLVAASIAVPALAQKMPDPAFSSVGRGWPLAASVSDLPEIGPNWIRQPGQPRNTPNLPLNGSRTAPQGYDALPRDIFTSDDFYADEQLWSDPRYFRCNSLMGTEVQRGIVSLPPVNTTNETENGPWGHCEYDYPREAIVSPYGFTTAQAHYEALLAETRERGGPAVYTLSDFPAGDWTGVYERPAQSVNHRNWYWGGHNQISTILSVLTPLYQQYMVQEVYHQVRGNAVWPSTFCWPEGFMRRWNWAAVWEHYIIATPDIVQISAGVADNFVTNIHVGRQFTIDDPANGSPRLGAAVPRWYGETIGFWDEDTLITWTSNIQGWKSHGMFEFSNRMQSIEIYTPIHDEAGGFVGLNHETILYDDEALAEPVRIVRNLHKINDFTDDDQTPYVFIECVQTIYSIDGQNLPMTPGSVFQYEMPDMYGRPWAAIWEKYFESGMSKPDVAEDLFNFE
jgi:hypothetical protein